MDEGNHEDSLSRQQTCNQRDIDPEHYALVKGRVSRFFFILSLVPFGIIYGGKIVEA